MSRDELVALLERERICGDPEALEAERYTSDPDPVLHREIPRPLYPVTPERAAENYALLKDIADRYGDA